MDISTMIIYMNSNINIQLMNVEIMKIHIIIEITGVDINIEKWGRININILLMSW
jgi:hypothetical protein